MTEILETGTIGTGEEAELEDLTTQETAGLN